MESEQIMRDMALALDERMEAERFLDMHLAESSDHNAKHGVLLQKLAAGLGTRSDRILAGSHRALRDQHRFEAREEAMKLSSLEDYIAGLSALLLMERGEFPSFA